jgi:hypothetical protein
MHEQGDWHQKSWTHKRVSFRLDAYTILVRRELIDLWQTVDQSYKMEPYEKPNPTMHTTDIWFSFTKPLNQWTSTRLKRERESIVIIRVLCVFNLWLCEICLRKMKMMLTPTYQAY